MCVLSSMSAVYVCFAVYVRRLCVFCRLCPPSMCVLPSMSAVYVCSSVYVRRLCVFCRLCPPSMCVLPSMSAVYVCSARLCVSAVYVCSAHAVSTRTLPLLVLCYIGHVSYQLVVPRHGSRSGVTLLSHVAIMQCLGTAINRVGLPYVTLRLVFWPKTALLNGNRTFRADCRQAMVCRVRCSYRWGCVNFRVN